MTPLSATSRMVAAMHAERAARPVPSAMQRLCAAQVLHLWDAPQIVHDWLSGTAPALRDAVETVAWAASRADHGPAGCAAKAVARACAGNAPHALINAAAAAVGLAAGARVSGRGTASYDAERQAADAFRAVWQPRLFPMASQRAAA